MRHHHCSNSSVEHNTKILNNGQIAVFKQEIRKLRSAKVASSRSRSDRIDSERCCKGTTAQRTGKLVKPNRIRLGSWSAQRPRGTVLWREGTSHIRNGGLEIYEETSE